MKYLGIIIGVVVGIVICVIVIKYNGKKSERFSPHVGYPNTNDSIFPEYPEYESIYNYNRRKDSRTDELNVGHYGTEKEASSFVTSVEKLRDTAAFTGPSNPADRAKPYPSPPGYFYGAFGYPEVYANVVFPYYYDWPYDVRGNFMSSDTLCEDVGKETKCYPDHPIKVSLHDPAIIPNNGTGYNAWKCCRGKVLGW